MLLRVGDIHPGMWAGMPVWLGIERIELLPDGSDTIWFRVLVSLWWPRLLWWFCQRSSESGEDFLARILSRKGARSVQEVEVRYR